MAGMGGDGVEESHRFFLKQFAEAQAAGLCEQCLSKLKGDKYER